MGRAGSDSGVIAQTSVRATCRADYPERESKSQRFSGLAPQTSAAGLRGSELEAGLHSSGAEAGLLHLHSSAPELSPEKGGGGPRSSWVG